MPSYSLEQYDPQLCPDEPVLAKCMMAKLGIDFQPELIIKKMIVDLASKISERMGIVEQGLAFCRLNDCSPGTEGWENWSTPSRDKRLSASFKSTESFASNIGHGQLFRIWLESTPLTPAPHLTILQFRQRLQKGLVSYDPRTLVEDRWAANNQAMERTVKGKVREFENERMIQLEAAAECRQNASECKNTKGSFEKFSSAELDYKERAILYEWVSLVQDEKVALDSELKDLFQNIWYRSPAPWDSMDERIGNLPSKGKGHLLKSKEVFYGGKRFLLLDDSRLYDIKAKIEIPLSINFYDAFTDALVAIDGTELKLFDQNLQQVRTIQTSISNLINARVYNFNDGWIFLYLKLDGSKPADYGLQNSVGWLINLSTGEIKEKFFFDLIVQSSCSPGLALGINSLKVIKPKGEVTTVEGYPSTYITSFCEFKDHSLLTLSITPNYQYSAGYFKDGIFHSLFDLNEPIHFSMLTNSTILLKEQDLYNPGKGLVLDAKLSPILRHDEMHVSVSSTPDQSIFLTKENNWKTWMVDGSSIKVLPMEFDANYPPVTSATPEWITTYDWNAKNASVLDYQGNVLESSTLFAKAFCGSLRSNECSSEDDDVMAETNLFPAEIQEFYLFSKYGPRIGREFKEVYVYSVGLISMGQDSEYFPGSYVTTGTSFQLFKDVVLWFPKKADDKP